MINKKNVTERLIIRPLKREDNFDWLEIFSSENVGKFIHKMDNIETVDKIINRKLEKYDTNSGQSFSVLEKNSTKVIGNIELKFLENDNTAEISYVFNDKYWNMGYATESSMALINFAFKTLHVKKIVADCLENNFSSCHILKDKLKMKQTGIESKMDKENNSLNYICFELENLD